jgi:hypothetical protein
MDDILHTADLRVPRIEDMPYWSSPPVQFVYQSTAPLAVGAYAWNDSPSPLTPLRPLVDNAAYYFRSVSLSANISELDFEINLVGSAVVPPIQFFTFLTGDANAVLFREPIQMVKYFQNFDYRYLWGRQKGNNQLLCAFRGALLQGPTLIGARSVTLKAIISAQEITDIEFTNRIKNKPYPVKAQGAA